jgi:DnaJ-class molecular chaperone
MVKFYSIEECYKVLGLDPKKNNSLNDIKRAYHEKALLYHPDKNKDNPLASEIFLKIKEAYEIILNPSYAYKKLKSYKSNDLDLIVNLEVTFSEGFFGKEFEFNFNSSTINLEKNKKNFHIDSIKFKLPEGSSGLYEEIFQKKGFKKEDSYGDLIVKVKINSHPIFLLQGKNVLSNISLPLSFFIKGGKTEVPTMYGVKEIKIKPGTAPGSSVNIPNCGVGGSNFHIAILNVIFPNKEDLKNDEWNKLDINWDI